MARLWVGPGRLHGASTSTTRLPPVVTIFGKTWLLHVREILQTTPEENLAMIEDTVRYLKQQDRIVVYDAEHAFDGYVDDLSFGFGPVTRYDLGS